MNRDDIISRFLIKYDYLSQEEACMIYETAKQTYLDLAFPFNHSETEIPEGRPRAWQWIADCMDEVLDKSGCSSMASYSENGLSITWDNSGISNSLRNRIMPKVGVFR